MSSSWVCVDANLVIRLVADPADTIVRALWENWDAENRLVGAPTLLYYEVANALYQYQKTGFLSPASTSLALKAALSLPIRLYGEANLHTLAMDLAERFSLPSTYDAHYLAVADRLGAEFWTADRKLFRAVQDAFPWVHQFS